ncbi:MAG: ABC transporter ATP-binding protein [Candidatus Delongbacteria bacterium]|nr:ABC transporter ATP-binding protein [Candidatus Delongbacteria bacterium]
MESVIVETRELCRNFGDIIAVDRLDLAIHPGEMFGLVGPDGAGKTTTIRMMCGIVSPSSGQIRVMGTSDPRRIKPHIGYLSQKFSLYGDLTVDENIRFFAEIHQVSHFQQRRDELLEFTRLTPYRTRLADRLSGGMKQKLALACTLIHTPQIIFLDEPTTGVDPVSRRDFWKILSNLTKTGITIIMTTPYLDEAERCHRVCLMHQAHNLITDTPQAIKQTIPGGMVEVICRPVRNALMILKSHPLVRDIQPFGDRINILISDPTHDLPELIRVLESNRIQILNQRLIPPSLESAFIWLINHHRNDNQDSTHPSSMRLS